MARKRFPDITADFAERVSRVEIQDAEHYNEGNIAQTAQAIIERMEESSPPRSQNLELGMTQGRKGQKLKRMTMAFSDLNYDFMRTYARQKGITATQFVNDLLSECRKRVLR